MANSRFRACDSKVKHTEQSAKDKIEFLANVKRRPVRGLRMYKCEYCYGWHLTSRKEDNHGE